MLTELEEAHTFLFLAKKISFPKVHSLKSNFGGGSLSGENMFWVWGLSIKRQAAESQYCSPVWHGWAVVCALCHHVPMGPVSPGPSQPEGRDWRCSSTLISVPIYAKGGNLSYGHVSVPYPEMCVLLDPAGRGWPRSWSRSLRILLCFHTQ